MADPGPHTTYLPLQCVTVQVTDTVKHQVYNQMRSFLSGFEHKHSCNPTLNHWQSDSSVTRHRRVWKVLKKVKLFYWSSSFFSLCSLSRASGCCSISTVSSCGGGCRYPPPERPSRSWWILRDSLWCRLCLSPMQGIASVKQRLSSSPTSWECRQVLQEYQSTVFFRD